MDPMLLQIGGIVVALKVLDFAERAIKAAKNGKGGNPGTSGGSTINGGLQREIGALGANVENLVDDLRNHHKESLSVEYDTLKAIEKLDDNEDGWHRRMRTSVDEQTAAVAKNTLEVQTMSAKVDKLNG